MRLRVNLQQKILLLVAGSMSLILLASSYLHSGRIRSLIEKDHYDNAVNQTIALGNRIAQYDYFSNLDDLEQEMQVVVSSRPDFRQIDVYENQQSVPRLIATTASGTANLLSAWDDSGPTITTGATSSQINRNNGEYWVITTPIGMANTPVSSRRWSTRALIANWSAVFIASTTSCCLAPSRLAMINL